MECPSCKAVISRPAREGGAILLNRYIRVTADGKMVVACQRCDKELERTPQGKLVLYVKGSSMRSEKQQRAA